MFFHLEVFQLATGEEEHVALLKAGDKGFFDGADFFAVGVDDADRGIGGNGANAHAMHAGDFAVADFVRVPSSSTTFFVAGIGFKTFAAFFDEVENPLKFFRR